MDNEWIDNDEDIHDSNNCELSKNEVIKLLLSQDTQIDLIAPKKFKSPIWERFRLVYFRGNFRCLSCAVLFGNVRTRKKRELKLMLKSIFIRIQRQNASLFKVSDP